MRSTALIIPTRGGRPYLPQIVQAAGCLVIVVWATERPPNIQRWWNVGIDVSGAEHVAIVNDDITLPVGLVQEMSAKLDETGASICYAGAERMTGWCFMLNTAHGIRPDERFAWYYGDNDLHEQACLLGGTTFVETWVEHHTPGTMHDEFADLIAQDAVEFNRKWGRVS